MINCIKYDYSYMLLHVFGKQYLVYGFWLMFLVLLDNRINFPSFSLVKICRVTVPCPFEHLFLYFEEHLVRVHLRGMIFDFTRCLHDITSYFCRMVKFTLCKSYFADCIIVVADEINKKVICLWIGVEKVIHALRSWGCLHHTAHWVIIDICRYPWVAHLIYATEPACCLKVENMFFHQHFPFMIKHIRLHIHIPHNLFKLFLKIRRLKKFLTNLYKIIYGQRNIQIYMVAHTQVYTKKNHICSKTQGDVYKKIGRYLFW